MECHPTMKTSEALSQAATRMHFKRAQLSERSQTRRPHASLCLCEMSRIAKSIEIEIDSHPKGRLGGMEALGDVS